jgi:hypothetical protein
MNRNKKSLKHFGKQLINFILKDGLFTIIKTGNKILKNGRNFIN